MAISEAQKRADAKYKREKTKQISLRFFPSEAEIFAHLQAQENKAAYIKALIRADMENSASGSH